MGRELWLLVLALVAVVLVGTTADLTPEVESDFFFSTDDPQLRTSEEISRLFPAGAQIFVRVAGEVRSPEYAAAVKALGDEMAAVPGVSGVRSLVSGPASPEAAFQSPFWRRLLVPEGEEATNVVVSLAEDADEGSAARRIGEIAAASERPTAISGVPYVVELIRRYLLRDLRVFSIASFAVFGLLIALLSRSLRVVAGTLAACLLACALTLGVLTVAGVPIGVLTANLVTLVFVLTLSHTVFLTANSRAALKESAAAERSEEARKAVRGAVRRTFSASLWCMVTTLLGFLSLLFASAKPLRELGVAGAVGALAAIAVAYLFYPPFLAGDRPAAGAGGRWRLFDGLPRVRNAVRVASVVLVAALGLTRLDFDPSLLSYFKPGTELADGLAVIDQDGGSSPLSIVVRDPEGARLDTNEGVAALDRAHASLEADPATGAILSPSPLLAEAKRANPLAAFAPYPVILDTLSGPAYEGIALSFVTAERDRAHFFLRMRESGRGERREAVIDRLRGAVEKEGLQAELVGGLYELQGKLSRLIRGSLLTGLGSLFLLFAGIAFWVSRTLRGSAAMVGALSAVPLFVLGVMGLAGVSLDIISSPAANVAIALGVDSMIHLATVARRHRKSGLSRAAAWARARGEMARPILGAALLVAMGFGIFALSSFPPSQRFGVAVMLGTAAAAAASLVLLPWLAAGRGRREEGADSA